MKSRRSIRIRGGIVLEFKSKPVEWLEVRGEITFQDAFGGGKRLDLEIVQHDLSAPPEFGEHDNHSFVRFQVGGAMEAA